MFTSLTISRLKKISLFVAGSLDRHVRLKVATRLAMYAQGNVGFLCCVSFGSSIAIPLSWIGFVFDLKSCAIKIMSQM
jgi:hypothetical protein